MSTDVDNKDSTFCSLYILGTAGRQVKPLRVGQLRFVGVKQVQLVVRTLKQFQKQALNYWRKDMLACCYIFYFFLQGEIVYKNKC